MPRPANPGPPYRRGGRPSADGWNRMAELSGPITVEPPLYARATSSGVTIRLDADSVAGAGVWAKVTGTLGPPGGYTLLVVSPAPGGAWTDGASTLAGREANNNPTVAAGTRVRAWFDSGTALWYFSFGQCT